ncbi:hypothetical protein [Metabacillus iocasae]|uniref:Uncharacterized protein n=1 Tax=Priestia iocasae TaxID=2291674 RepID=A0ABS2QX90_9BACI|nr:hypothetical protein [Metabacillus iocasae]MBM7703099.1 hypothetical protein [Metabacillus iocasae]
MTTNYSQSQVATSYQGLKNNYLFKRTVGSLRINFVNVRSVLFLLIVMISGFIV